MKLLKIPYDKAMHLIYGILIFVVSYFITSLITSFEFIPVLIGLFMVTIFGIGKEIYDYHYPKKHTSDVFDAIYTIVGGLIGFLIFLIGLL